MLEFKWAFGLVVTLLVGSFSYTHKVEKDSASKDDIRYLRKRVDSIHDHLMGKKQ